MKSFAAVIVALGLVRSIASAQCYPKPIHFDDGSAETSLQIQTPPQSGNWASVNFGSAYGGKLICELLVDASTCDPGAQGTIGLYPANLSVDLSGNTPNFSAPLVVMPATLPIGECPEYTEFDIPDVVLPAATIIHAVFIWNSPTPTTSVCVDTNSVSGTSFFGSSTSSIGTPLAAGNWMIRLGRPWPAHTLQVNGMTSLTAPRGSRDCFNYWGTNAGQTFTLQKHIFGPFWGNVYTGTTSNQCCPHLGQKCYKCPPPFNGTYRVRYAPLLFTNSVTVTLTGTACSTDCPWGIADDGFLEDWFRPAGTGPAGPTDHVSVGFPAPTPDKTIIGVDLTYKNDCVGPPPSFASVGIYPPNLALDPACCTPDLSKPLSFVSNVTVPIDPCGTFFVDLPDITTTSTAGCYFADVQWSTGDTCLWVGVDSDGTDNPDCDYTPGAACGSVYTIDGYATPGISAGVNYMIRLRTL